jgi:hypothetical protein
MNVRIGLYDFFAYTVPGGLNLFTILYILVRFKVVQVNQQFQDFILSAAGILLITIASYVFGLLFDLLTSRWVRLFRAKNFPQHILDEFKKIHPQIEIRFQAFDWSVLLAKIRNENVENGSMIEQNNVTNLMLRNLSFGFALLGIVQLIEFALTINTLNIVLAIIFTVLSGFAQAQSTKFARIFFFQIFEYSTARDMMGVKFSEYKFPKKAISAKKTHTSAPSELKNDKRK